MKKKLLSLALVLIIIASAFSLVACNPTSINTVGAEALTRWLTSDEALTLIKDFGKADYGEALFYILDDVEKSELVIPQATKKTKTIRVSTTTSVNDSGLLGAIIPEFEKKYGYKVEIASAGTGAAINAARMGNADLILVHSKSQEETFVNEGYALKLDNYQSERISFMYNYFVLVGPSVDSGNVKNASNIKDAFSTIATQELQFISRGDKSGTHAKEVTLWNKSLGVDMETVPESIQDWYNAAGQGMGACLTMANEKSAYILTDKATFLSYKNGSTDNLSNLSILYERDADLQNTYTLIAVNPKSVFIKDAK